MIQHSVRIYPSPTVNANLTQLPLGTRDVRSRALNTHSNRQCASSSSTDRDGSLLMTASDRRRWKSNCKVRGTRAQNQEECMDGSDLPLDDRPSEVKQDGSGIHVLQSACRAATLISLVSAFCVSLFSESLNHQSCVLRAIRDGYTDEDDMHCHPWIRALSSDGCGY